jgi:hypothetical protein
LAMDLTAETCHVLGRDGVVLMRQGQQEHFRRGQSFSVRELGPFQRLEPEAGLPPGLLEQVRLARSHPKAGELRKPPPEITELVEGREAARRNRDWPAADAFRSQLRDLGWKVLDTPEGPRLEPASPGLADNEIEVA